MARGTARTEYGATMARLGAGLTGIDVHARSALIAAAFHGGLSVMSQCCEPPEQLDEQARRFVRNTGARAGRASADPVCPEVFGKASSPAATMISRSEWAIAIASRRFSASTSKSKVMKSHSVQVPALRGEDVNRDTPEIDDVLQRLDVIDEKALARAALTIFWRQLQRRHPGWQPLRARSTGKSACPRCHRDSAPKSRDDASDTAASLLLPARNTR